MIKVPESNYTDYYEQARFQITWRIIVVLSAVLLLLDIGFYAIEPRFVLHYTLGFLITLLSAFYLYYRRNYKPVAIVVSITSFFLVVSSLYFIPRAVHYIEPFWLFIITLYLYFTLGKWWGSAMLIADILALVIYFNFFLNKNIQNFEELARGQSITMSVEFATCVLILGYIVHQFIITNRYAEEQMRLSNEALKIEKNLVEKQNKEKTVLLQEIHHRVKNNLQVVTSLLRVQASKLSSQEAQLNFQDAINRIMTMALIHQKMYEKENLSEIELNDYFSDLIEDIRNSGLTDRQIVINLDIQIERIGAKTIVPLALMINELTTNSMKHASSKEDTLRISLALSEGVGGKILMRYKDNGSWKEAGTDTSFGLQLIETFTEQLEGELKRESNSDGTEYSFELNNLEIYG